MKKTKLMSIWLLLCSCSIWATTWNTPEMISALGEGADFSQIAINDSLDGLAVWVFSDNGSNSIVQGNNLLAGVWQTAEDLSTTTNFADESDVAINDSSIGVATWVELIGTDYFIRTSVFDGTSWQTPTTISLGSMGSTPKVSINSSGNAIVVWNRFASGTNETRASQYTLGVWGTPVTLSTDETSANAQVAYSDAGNALAIWSTYDGTSNVIRSSTFNGLLWSTPETISEAGQTASSPQIAINADGDGIAVWGTDTDNGTVVIEGAFFTNSLGTWGLPEEISNPANDSFSPQIAMNNSGNAVAVWSFFDGSNYRVRSSFYSGSWSDPVTVSSSGETTLPPQVSMDNSNRAVAVWEANPPSSNPIIKSATLISGNWATPQPLSDPLDICHHPQISMNDTNGAYAIWTCYDGTNYFVEATQGTVS